MPTAAARGLLERERELDAATQAMERAAAGDGGVLTFLGPAGIGKTTLLEALRERAAAREIRILSARCSQLETGFPFGVARQLCEPVLSEMPEPDSAQLLAGAAGLARPLLGRAADDDAAPGGESAFAALHGLYWLVANLAERGPLAILVDDAHWADPDSLRFLAYLSSRLEGLPVLVASTVRTAEPESEQELIAALLAAPGLVIEPSPLTETAVGELAGVRLGREVAPEFARACHEASGGNPFFCEELLEAAVARGVTPDAAAAASVGEIGPETVGRAVLSRLARLPQPCTDLAQAVAVLGGRTELRQAAALARLDIDEAARCADALASVQLLRGERPLDFAHPIVRTAIYRGMGPLERAEMHRDAARALFESGAAPEDLAPHLLEVEPSGDARVVQQLRASAAAAVERGALRMAATHLERAMQEPPEPSQLAATALELGLVMLSDGHREAPARVRRAVELATPGPQRLELGLRAGRALGRASQAEAVRVCRLALEGAEPGGDTYSRIVAETIMPASLFAETTAFAWDQLERSEGEDAPGSGPEALITIDRAWERTVRGAPADEVRELVEGALRGGALAGEADSLLVSMSAAILVLNEGLELAAQLCDIGIEQARANGWPGPLAYAQWLRANIQYRRGDLDEAGADAAASFAFAREHGADVAMPWSAAILSDVLVERGELDEAEAVHGRCAPAPDIADFTWALLIESRGRMRLAQGRDEEALAELREAGRRWESIGMVNLAIAQWRTAAVAALSRLGKGNEARELAAEQLAIARGAGAAQALGIALRTAGLSAEGDERIGLLREAVAALEGSDARLERAHTQVELGSALRLAGEEEAAREPLNLGMAAARACGATPLAERAFEELQATGARPRKLVRGGLEALTPSERRVAGMAASGLSNKEIAQTLFVTVRTVETHLRHTYRKLDIASREELSAALAPDPLLA